MMSSLSQIIVATEDYALQAVHTLSVYHRVFPEVRGEGGSPEDAAVRLGEWLTRTLDSATSDWRRAMLERAIEDVRAFAKRDRLEAGGTY